MDGEWADGGYVEVAPPVAETVEVRAAAAPAVPRGRLAVAAAPHSAIGRCARLPGQDVHLGEVPLVEALRAEGYQGAGGCCQVVQSGSRVTPARRRFRAGGLRGWSRCR